MWLSKTNLFILVLVSMTLFFGLGCESDKQKRIAEAQKCLDAVDSTTKYGAAQASHCLSPIESLSSEQAKILKCSIKMLVGGVTVTKIVNAFDSLNGSNTQKEAILIGALSMDTIAQSDDAYVTCNETGIETLQYFGSLSRIGTYMVSAAGLLDYSNDPGFPSPEQASALLTMCSGACLTVMAESAITVSDSYCQSSSSDQQICQDINSAIDSSEDPETQASYLIDLFQD